MNDPSCTFCKIVSGELGAEIVYQDSDSIAFLDHRPLFPGHVLLCPRSHFETIVDLPAQLTGPMLKKIQLLAQAVEAAVDAEGIFIAINNRVSQGVPHLHIHIVPRKRRDGLKGFFWPRHRYQDEAASETVRYAIEREIQKLLK